MVKTGIRVFLENLFPSDLREHTIPLTLQAWEEDNRKQEFSQTGYQDQENALFMARELVKCLEYVCEFLDSGQKGFLPGDLSVESIQKMEVMLQSSLEDLVLQRDSHNHLQEKDSLLSALYTNL